jgi:FMN phosphatase YigB (HAD superfamily)
LRLKWAGIDPSLFKSVTHAGRMRACKPAKEYYQDLLSQEGLTANECLLVGDDWLNDLSATQVGIPVFILSKRTQLRAIERTSTPAWQGSYTMLKTIVKALS